MNIKRKLLKLAGKSDFSLDDNIGLGYLLGICWRYGWMMIRGGLLSICRKNISNDIFVGKSVKLIVKRKITIGHKVKLHDRVYIDALSDSTGGGYFLGTMWCSEETHELSAPAVYPV